MNDSRTPSESRGMSASLWEIAIAGRKPGIAEDPELARRALVQYPTIEALAASTADGPTQEEA